MKKFGVDWRFCPECQCIQHYIVNDPANSAVEWTHCNHDYRPNSAKAVLENQAMELDQIGSGDLRELFGEVRTYQSPYEIDSTIAIVRWIFGKPMNIVEIGSFHGGTANLMRFYLPTKKLVCVDRCFDYWMAGDIGCIKIEGDSVASIGRVEEVLAGEPIDLLFIDGDHSYAGEMADYRTYESLVREGGIIALHDTHSIADVGRVFQEIPGKMKIDIYSYQGIGLVVK